MSPPLPSTGTRFHYIDALRGIAALGVVFYHLIFHTPLGETVYQNLLPAAVEFLFYLGRFGVEIFFVLSGFVIAHSLRHSALGWPDLWNFAFRRQLRLDPPYWVMIAVTVLLGTVLPALVWEPAHSAISARDVLFNMFYLQVISRSATTIVPPSWTLCLEVQFYLVFILLLFVGRNQRKTKTDFCFSQFSIVLLFVSGALSLLLRLVANRPAWFISHWHYFAVGALVYFCWQGLLSKRYLYGFLALFFVIALLCPTHSMTSSFEKGGMLTGLATALSIHVLGARERLSWGGNLRVIQYFGRLSYSLYIVHYLVLTVITRLGFGYSGDDVAYGLLWGALALVLAVGFSQILHWLVEKPSMKAASRFRRGAESSAPLVPAEIRG